MLPFTVRLRTGVSVYRQLVYAVQKAVVSGDSCCPATGFLPYRNLSQELRINPNTAQKVVRRLVDPGAPGRSSRASAPSSASFRSRRPGSATGTRSALLEDEVEQLVVEAGAEGCP